MLPVVQNKNRACAVSVQLIINHLHDSNSCYISYSKILIIEIMLHFQGNRHTV